MKAIAEIFVFTKRILPFLVFAFFLTYLLSPAFEDSVKRNGTITMRSGWTQTYWDVLWLGNVPRLYREDVFYIIFVILPVSIAEVGFCILPILRWKYLPAWLNFLLGGFFFLGIISFAGLVNSSAKTSYGVYFWFAAASCAVIYCLLPLAKILRDMTSKKFCIIVFCPLFGTTFLLGIFFYKIYYGKVFGFKRATLASPDGRYEIVVLARGIDLFPGAPGDAGGVPGNVSLVDLKSGKRIGREPLEMAQFADSCKWTTTDFTIVDVGQWQLPSGKFDAVW
jgi:hypothetical protein